MSFRDNMDHLLTNVKVAIITVVGTIGAGLGNVFDLINHDVLGKLATIAGIILSCVLIYTHWRRGRIEYDHTKLENEKLKIETEALSKKIK